MSNTTTTKEEEYYNDFDPKAKSIHRAIDKLVITYGWKHFFHAVFEYQKNKIKSGYIFKK
jgi:hypothetical protein